MTGCDIIILMKNTITVVVPCYNVEQYLFRCLDSLVHQSYKKFEVIMIEDVSTDQTKKIVESYSKKFDNFRAIYNKTNKGLGHARNLGIINTKTKYIVFLDSDDWLPVNFLEEMLKSIKTNKSDLSICDIYIRYDNTKYDRLIKQYNLTKDKRGFIDVGMAASSCNKMFKTILFKNLIYPEDIINEDIPVVLPILCKFKASYSNYTHYNYYQRLTSIQNKKIDLRRLDIFKAIALLKEKQINKKYLRIIIWHQITSLLLYVIPRINKLGDRIIFLKKFLESMTKHGITLDSNKLGTYSKFSRARMIYIKNVIDGINKKKLFFVCIIMEIFSLLEQNKENLKPIIRMVRSLLHIFRNPKSSVRHYIKKIFYKTYRNNVIDRDIDLSKLITLAKYQYKLRKSKEVSVIVPNFNYERFLIQRLHSILNQNEKIAEIIILDDNSSDGSNQLVEIIKSKIERYVPVIFIKNNINQGVFKQWQRGLLLARYEYIWIAEADDYSDPEFLSNVIVPMRDNSKVVISYCNTGYINAEGYLIGDVKKDIDYLNCGHWDKSYINSGLSEAKHYSYLNNTIANVSSVLFRKTKDINYDNLIEQAIQYKQVGDWLFYLNYMILGDIAYTDKILNYYRVHGNNVSSNMKAKEHLREIQEVYKYSTEKLGLGNKQKKLMLRRIKMLRNNWGLEKSS